MLTTQTQPRPPKNRTIHGYVLTMYFSVGGLGYVWGVNIITFVLTMYFSVFKVVLVMSGELA
jgi:hypothetical protein